MKRLRLGYLEIFFVALIFLTVAARAVDAWPASSRDIETVRALAASNDRARSFVETSLSAEKRPSRKQLRRWRERVAAFESGTARRGANPSGRTAVSGATQGTEFGAEHR